MKSRTCCSVCGDEECVRHPGVLQFALLLVNACALALLALFILIVSVTFVTAD